MIYVTRFDGQHLTLAQNLLFVVSAGTVPWFLESAFNFIPQGGGDHYQGHRCPGEWITLELLKAASCLLTRAMRYDVPEQDLRVDLSRMPAIPESGFVIRNVQAMNILTNSTSSSTMI